jgi:hypothetical protein
VIGVVALGFDLICKEKEVREVGRPIFIIPRILMEERVQQDCRVGTQTGLALLDLLIGEHFSLVGNLVNFLCFLLFSVGFFMSFLFFLKNKVSVLILNRWLLILSSGHDLILFLNRWFLNGIEYTLVEVVTVTHLVLDRPGHLEKVQAWIRLGYYQ